MSSELKEQKQRFEDLMRWVVVHCENCPAKEVCYSKDTTTAEVTVTCEDTWWHYIQTGEILI